MDKDLEELKVKAQQMLKKCIVPRVQTTNI